MGLFLKNLLFTLFVPGTVAVTIPWLLARPLHPPALGSRAVVAGIVIAAALALFLECVWQFGRRGRGTPFVADPPKALVAYGPYLWVRNPMYWSVTTLVLGEALFFASNTLALYGAALPPIFHLFVVFYEEPSLERRFGESYREYLRQVNRWLPRPPRR